MRKLTVDDIADHRAYERERDAFRRYIIDLKRRRRIALGALLSIVSVFSNTMLRRSPSAMRRRRFRSMM